MRNVHTTLATFACLLLALAAGAQTQAPAKQDAGSLGVSLAMPDGHFIAYPIQHGTAPEDLLPIPITGYKNVFGIRMYPHMAGDKVALRVWAMVPKKQFVNNPAATDPAKVPHDHLYLGDYVLGREGDSLQIADLTKVGLPALTAKVVRAHFSTDSPTDPCCCTTDGLVCCGRTFVEMCASCPCPTCGNLRSAKKLYRPGSSAASPAKPQPPVKVENR